MLKICDLESVTGDQQIAWPLFLLVPWEEDVTVVSADGHSVASKAAAADFQSFGLVVEDQEVLPGAAAAVAVELEQPNRYPMEAECCSTVAQQVVL